MSRRLRHLLADGPWVVEVTTRAIHGRFLTRPSPELNETVIGVLGRAQALYPLPVHGICVLSNHYHLLLSAGDSKTLSSFMCYFNSNVAREIARLVDWRDKVWARRYQAIVVSHEPEDQIDRLKYILANSVKEGLVEHPFEWPGVHCAKALACGEELHGCWYDRTKEYIAGRRGKEVPRSDLVEEHSVRLEPLPCWRHLEEEERQELVAGLIDEVVEEAAVRRKKRGLRCFGVKAIKAQRPDDRPQDVNRSDAPDFHVSDPEVAKPLRDGYDNFVKKFRLAAQQLRAGNRLTAFPEDCFPPGLPYVPYVRGDPAR